MKKLEQLKKEMIDAKEAYKIFIESNSRRRTYEDTLYQIKETVFFGPAVECSEPRIFNLTEEDLNKFHRLEQNVKDTHSAYIKEYMNSNKNRIEESVDLRIKEQEKFDKLISDLNTNIVCGVQVGNKIMDSQLYKVQEKLILSQSKYTTGRFNGKYVTIDPNMKWDDLRIFDDSNNELINLSDFGYDNNLI